MQYCFQLLIRSPTESLGMNSGSLFAADGPLVVLSAAEMVAG